MADMNLGPWDVGIDNVSPEGSRKPGTVVDAVNVEFDRAGGASLRRGMELASAGRWTSLWTSRLRRSFAVVGGNLCKVSVSANTISYTSIYGLSGDHRMSFADVNGDIVCTNRLESLRILADDTVIPLGLDRPDWIGIAASGAGGLYAGRYMVAIAELRNEEEGPLSPASFVDVAEGGGITVTVPLDAAGYSVYRSSANGDVMYSAGTVAMGGSMLLGAAPLGRAADTKYLDRLPAGDIIRYWRGLVLVARGRIIYWSEPMRFGLYSPRHNFVQLPNEVELMEPVAGGVYVGDKNGVSFLAGTTPMEWQVKTKSGVRALKHSGATVPASTLPGNEGVDEEVAVWLSRNGFCIGSPDGAILETQSKRIAIPDAQIGGKGSTVLYDRRLITTIQ